MKIGILTFHFVYNYGAMLQAYALSHYLNSWDNVDCELIDYRPRTIDFLYHPDWLDFVNHPKTILRNYIKKKKSHADFREFENFIDTYFILSKRIRNDLEFNAILDQYDAVFVGSDQVWNPWITGHDKNYLLYNSKDSLRKFSYAASIGSDKVDNEWKCNMKVLLNFEKISVRETSGCQLMEEILISKKVKCIADPVFLLPPDIWRRLEKRVTETSEYLLFYSLNNSSNLEERAKSMSRKLGLKIVSIHPLYKSALGVNRCNIGPEQFLWLIDHAEYVCTDSFHATAFSAILSKKTIVKYDTGKGNRIWNLLDMLGEVIDENPLGIGTYNFKCNSKLSKLRKDGYMFIKECIEKEIF